jgi:branched-chain amino acid aminotransferase
VSRGEGDLGLDPRKCHGNPTVVIIADKITLYPESLYKNGLDIITVPTVRNVAEALNPQIKSLNYLNNIMAKIEAVNGGCQEALMINSLGFVCECTGDNVFIIRKGILLTPPASMGALDGITRGAVLEIAEKSKIAYKESIFTRHDIFISDECFLTGTAAELIPVVKVDGRVIGNGKPGPITQKIIAEFKKLTKTSGVKYKL